MTSSGRIHGEFLRLLHILAHRRTQRYFASLGDDEPRVDAFTWRRSQFFWQHLADMGLANAVAVARRAHLARPTRPRLCAQPSVIDPLLSQPPPPPPASQSRSPPASLFLGVDLACYDPSSRFTHSPFSAMP